MLFMYSLGGWETTKVRLDERNVFCSKGMTFDFHLYIHLALNAAKTPAQRESEMEGTKGSGGGSQSWPGS
jgi:hypothetical protein